MLDTRNNPPFLNDFLKYITTILNKSKNTVKEYNYDIAHFLKYLMYHYNLTEEENIKNIDISNMDVNILKKVTLTDIHDFLFYLTETYNSKPATRARKVSCLRVFFNYLTKKMHILEVNPASRIRNPYFRKKIA